MSKIARVPLSLQPPRNRYMWYIFRGEIGLRVPVCSSLASRALSHVRENWVACAFIWFFITHTMPQSWVVTITMCYDFSPAEGGVGKPRRDAPELISLMSTCVLVDLQNLSLHVTVCGPLSWQCLGSLTSPVSLGSVLVCVDLCLGSVLAVSWQCHGRTRRSPGGGAWHTYVYTWCGASAHRTVG
jgi:hypothetical protein